MAARDRAMSSSIASKGRLCVRSFDQLSALLEDPYHEQQSGILKSATLDELGRFKIWAGNIGAFQESSSRSSLQFRLKEAPNIAIQAEELLDELNQCLEDSM